LKNTDTSGRGVQEALIDTPMIHGQCDRIVDIFSPALR